MADREKVIKGLEQHRNGSLFDRCGNCPYYEVADEPFSCRDELISDSLELLKEQEEQIERLEYDLAITKDNLNYYVNGNN